MNNFFFLFLDWSGTILIIIAAYLLSLKKASNPKLRFKVFALFFGSNIVWIPFALILRTYGFLITQIILFFINLKGMITNMEEIRYGSV